MVRWTSTNQFYFVLDTENKYNDALNHSQGEVLCGWDTLTHVSFAPALHAYKPHAC